MSRTPSLKEFTAPRYWPTWFGLGLFRLLALLPLPVLHLLGAGVGELAWLGHVPRRRIALRNIERCFPELDEATRRRLVRSHFRELAQSFLATGIHWWASRRRLDRLVRLRDRRHLDDAVATGRVVILLAPHFVALELGGIYLSAELDGVSMYQRSKNALFDEIVRRRRGRFGGVMLERKTDPRTLIRRIRELKAFYYLPDQDPGRRRAVFAPFFNVPAATFAALGRLARLTDALVVPCFTRQLPRGRGYEIIFRAAMAGFPTGDDVEDARQMNRVIEHGVLEMPEQYFWVHRRFKSRPGPEPDFYASTVAPPTVE